MFSKSNYIHRFSKVLYIFGIIDSIWSSVSSGPIFHIYFFVNGHCLGWKSHSKRMKGFSKPIKLNSSESFRAIHALQLKKISFFENGQVTLSLT